MQRRGSSPDQHRQTTPDPHMQGCWVEASSGSGWGSPGSLVPSQGCFEFTEVPVANIKSQKKRIRTNAKAADRNRAVKNELKTRLKKARATAGEESNTEDVRLAVKRIDMAAAKGIIHKNTAARRKSRLMKKVNAAG